MTNNIPKTITVSAAWMAACGFAAVDTEMQVISIVSVTPAGERMFKVIRPNDNREWTVAEWRIVKAPVPTKPTIIYDLSKLAPSVRAMIENSPKFSKWFSQKPDSMLRLDGSTKVIKGNKLGYRTAIMYLAPANMSGVNVCPMAATAACADACLNTSGRGAMTGVQMSRLRKTLFWMQYQSDAVDMIKSEIKTFEARSIKQGWSLLVRLNGTSDIRFENYGIIQSFPTVQFYDYTKLANRKHVPANYDLTFSYSGVAAYQPQVAIAIANGMRIAVVFSDRAIVLKALAKGWKFYGLDMVDGDDTDIRHLDPIGSAVALYAKGKAKQDTSGFVVR